MKYRIMVYVTIVVMGLNSQLNAAVELHDSKQALGTKQDCKTLEKDIQAKTVKLKTAKNPKDIKKLTEEKNAAEHNHNKLCKDHK